MRQVYSRSINAGTELRPGDLFVIASSTGYDVMPLLCDGEMFMVVSIKDLPATHNISRRLLTLLNKNKLIEQEFYDGDMICLSQYQRMKINAI